MAIIKSKLRNGAELFIEEPSLNTETQELDDEFRDTPKVIGKVLDAGRNLIQEAMLGIRMCADEIVEGIESLGKIKPDEIEVSLAFKLSAEAGAILTSIGGEAQLQVKLVWKNNDKGLKQK